MTSPPPERTVPPYDASPHEYTPSCVVCLLGLRGLLCAQSSGVEDAGRGQALAVPLLIILELAESIYRIGRIREQSRGGPSRVRCRTAWRGVARRQAARRGAARGACSSPTFRGLSRPATRPPRAAPTRRDPPRPPCDPRRPLRPAPARTRARTIKSTVEDSPFLRRGISSAPALYVESGGTLPQPRLAPPAPHRAGP